MNKNRYGIFFLFAILFFFSQEYVYSQRSIKPVPAPDKVISEDSKYVQNYGSEIESPHKELLDLNSKNASELKKVKSYNYFRIDKSERSLWNGKHWKPVDYPLTVYVKTTSSKFFKTLYRSYIDYALSIWEGADPRIKFRYVSGSRDADILIIFEENLIMKYDDNYLGITDYQVDDDKSIERSYIEIGLVKFNYEPVSDGEIKATIIHELGHALGLGHSDNETDIMFPFINPFSGNEMGYNELSTGDIEAVKSVVNLGFE